MTNQDIRYSNHDPTQFFKTLNTRISDYFKQQNLSRKGEGRLLGKAIILLAILCVPYFAILTLPLPELVMLVLCLVMGAGMALVGTSIMHEGCHGAFSSNKWINSLAAGTMYLLGGDKLIWQTSHNVLHHTYTNIYGHDVDLEAGNGIIRFTEHAEWQPKHRFQHIYAFFLYSLLTLTWVFLTDFLKMRKFSKRNYFPPSQANPAINWSRLIFFKLVAYTIWLVIPTIVLALPFWKILVGFLLMHLVAGVALTLIFQLAHLTGAAAMPVPDDQGNMENTWAIHQLYTTANWATGTPVGNWCTGGLNHQIEHHLFPGISHVHYPRIAPIVKQTAEEFGLPYIEYKTLGQALAAHYAHLRDLGTHPDTSIGHQPKTLQHPG